MGPFHGIWVAATTFVPTFLAIVCGIPYLTSPPTASRYSVDREDSKPPAMSLRAPEKGFGRVPLNDKPSERRAVLPVGFADAPVRLVSTPTVESPGNAAVSATPTTIPQPAARLVPPSIQLEPADQRSGPTVTNDDTWARGPAFTSQDSADHFAARMRRVGFPAHVRREDRGGTRWVVWIGNPAE